MTPEQHLIVNVCLTVLGTAVGYLIAQYILLSKCQDYYERLVDCEDDLKDAEDLLEVFRVASRSVIGKIEQVGDETDWLNGPETFRRYEWHEVEPLAKCLERQQKREEEIASTPSS